MVALHREAAQDEAIARQGHDRCVELELRERVLARLDRGALEARDPRQHLRRAAVEQPAAARREGPRTAAQQPHAHVDDPAGLQRATLHDGVTAPRLRLGEAEVERGALARDGLVDRGAVHLHAAHLAGGRRSGEATGQERDLVTDADAARPQRPRHDGAEPLHREDAIDGEAQEARGISARRVGQGAADRGLERVQALAGPRGARHDGRVLEERARERTRNVGDRALSPLVRGHEVRLGQRDDAATRAEQLTDVEVLARLRHHALIAGDHQHDEVDADGARDHRAHEPLVPGHVHDADHATVAEVEVGEAELDGDAAGLLLLQPVGVDAGERAHERGLAVVDVARGPDDPPDRPHRASSTARSAATTSASCDGKIVRRSSRKRSRSR